MNVFVMIFVMIFVMPPGLLLSLCLKLCRTLSLPCLSNSKIQLKLIDGLL